VVGDRDRWHAAFGGLPDKIPGANGAIQQRVFGVTMQMNKRNYSHWQTSITV
jgi:hypothetical protein